MKKNMSDVDKAIRGVLGIAALVVGLWVTTGTWSIILYVFAGIMIITSLAGVCPLYMLFNISTKKD
jgi:hypothetical protein